MLPPASLITDHKKGLTFAAAGGFIIAWDIPVIRLAGADPWTTLLLRGPIAAIALLIGAYIMKRMKWSDAKIIDGWDTVIFAVIHAIVTMAFVVAIFHTTTANLVFIVAFSSMFALILSTLFLGERHPVITWITVCISLVGIGFITIGDIISVGQQNTFGNSMALLASIGLALEVIFVRRSGKNLSFAVFLAPLITSLVAIPFVMVNGIHFERIEFIIINGILITPLAGALLTLAALYITAPETAMFYLIETVLAPIFVWLIFEEQPTTNTLIGGAIIIGAIFFHSYSKVSTQKRRRLPPNAAI